MDRARLLKIGKILWMVLVYVFAVIGFVLVVTYFAVRLGFTNTSGIIDTQREAFLDAAASTTPVTTSQVATPKPVSEVSAAPNYPIGTSWQNTEEWQILSSAIVKDTTAINRAAKDSSVPARLIVANLIVEQLRLFFTERAFYKQFFAPLKILGSQTQFSWGVMGMKEATAVQVENNLKNPTSPFYPGAEYEHLLDFTSAQSDNSKERFTRMTDQHNHYWSYLYAGLSIKEIEAQWEKAGFPIANRPDVLATLYNIGFEHSKPNANPNVGGAAISINGVLYSFGGLASEFYNSELLLAQFPK